MRSHHNIYRTPLAVKLRGFSVHEFAYPERRRRVSRLHQATAAEGEIRPLVETTVNHEAGFDVLCKDVFLYVDSQLGGKAHEAGAIWQGGHR